MTEEEKPTTQEAPVTEFKEAVAPVEAAPAEAEKPAEEAPKEAPSEEKPATPAEEVKPEGEGEMKEIEVLEFSLTGEEIDELIGKLTQLKQLKTSISFDVDEENEFTIHYESDEEPAGEASAEEKPVETAPVEKPTEEKTAEAPVEEKKEVPSLDNVERQ